MMKTPKIMSKEREKDDRTAAKMGTLFGLKNTVSASATGNCTFNRSTGTNASLLSLCMPTEVDPGESQS